MPEIALSQKKINYHGPSPEELEGGFPLVLLHGAAGDGRVWRKVLDELSDEGIRALALDLPGHGRSGGESSGFIEPLAHCLAEIADHFGWRKFFLAGHSMGGAAALSFALRHGERLAGLGLIATGAKLKVAPIILQLIEDDYARAVEFAMAGLSSPRTDEESRKLVSAMMSDAGPRTALDDFTACNNFNVIGRLDAIDVPTMVVSGDADYMTPLKYSQYLADHIAESRLELIEGAGHMLMLEAPARLAELLAELVRGW